MHCQVFRRETAFEQGAPVNLPISAEIYREAVWFVAFCPKVPEANGQWLTEEERSQSSRQAILLLMEDRREDAKSRLDDEATPLELA
jgi:predicted RNase H-like HicB family nuclease